MKIVSFKEFNKIIDEMAVETGVNGDTFDRTNEWKTHLGSPFTKLLKYIVFNILSIIFRK